MNNSKNILIITVLALVLLSLSAFTVNQTQYVLVQRLGEEGLMACRGRPGAGPSALPLGQRPGAILSRHGRRGMR